MASERPQGEQTRESFIREVFEIAIEALPDEERARLARAKLLYGAGLPGVRGLCYYSAWRADGPVDVLEIGARSEESLVQLSGTTIHESAHALAGPGAGHGPDWKTAAQRLGLVRALAAGQAYEDSELSPVLLARLKAIAPPTDGNPHFHEALNHPTPLGTRPRPCSLGIGVRGGRSRGKGSGSRLRLYHCSCEPPVKVRVASDELRAHCDRCGKPFEPPAPTAGSSAGAPA
jgi:hypothetical protein